MLGKGASDAEHLCYVREIDTFSRNRANHAVNLAKQQGIFQRAYRRKIESADFTDEIMEKVVALVGRAVSSRRITASHGLAQNQIAVAFGKKNEAGDNIVRHIGIALENGDFIHSLGAVRIESLSPNSPIYSAYFAERFLGAYTIDLSLQDVPNAEALSENAFYQVPAQKMSVNRSH